MLTELVDTTAISPNFAHTLSASGSEKRDREAYHDFDGELAKDCTLSKEHHQHKSRRIGRSYRLLIPKDSRTSGQPISQRDCFLLKDWLSSDLVDIP